jgi:hypothetical protein
MEKLLVIAGVWTMCAMCAVFFIRGATRNVTRASTQHEREECSHVQAGCAHANDA